MPPTPPSPNNPPPNSSGLSLADVLKRLADAVEKLSGVGGAAAPRSLGSKLVQGARQLFGRSGRSRFKGFTGFGAKAGGRFKGMTAKAVRGAKALASGVTRLFTGPTTAAQAQPPQGARGATTARGAASPTRFGRARGFQKMLGGLAKAFPGSKFGQVRAFAGQMQGISKGLNVAAGGARAAGLTRLAGGLGGAGAMAGRAAAVAGGPAGIAVAAVAALAEAGWKCAKAIHGMSEEALREQERLAQSSGSMAAVFAEKRIRDTLRDMQQGNQQAASARELEQANANLKDELAKIETTINIVKNSVLAPLEDFMAGLISPISERLDELNRNLAGNPEDAVETSLRRLADETDRRRAAGDAAFQRPDVREFRP